MQRLIDLINHLPPGTQFTTTKDFEQMTGRAGEHIGIVQACSLVIAVGYQDIQGIRESDGSIISIYGEGAWTPWPAFFVSIGTE